jgi:hypothetical protein
VDFGEPLPQGSLWLPLGGPYSITLEASQPWPAGMVVDFLIEGDGSPITWTATISGRDATWSKTIAEVAAVTGSNRRSATVRRTPSGGEPIPWYRLTVRTT